jgi:hypothetical protein
MGRCHERTGSMPIHGNGAMYFCLFSLPLLIFVPTGGLRPIFAVFQVLQPMERPAPIRNS